MTMTERLLEATKEIWDGYNETPFVEGIADGSLDHEKFKIYMIQDYLYLLTIQRYFHRNGEGEKPRRYAPVRGLYPFDLDGEMDIHRAYMTRLGIAKEEAEQTPVALDNLSYTSYMLRVAYGKERRRSWRPILSCALSYEFIAKKILAEYPGCR